MNFAFKETKNPRTGKFERAKWIESYFAKGVTGVKFADGTIYNPAMVELKIREDDYYEKQEAARKFRRVLRSTP